MLALFCREGNNVEVVQKFIDICIKSRDWTKAVWLQLRLLMVHSPASPFGRPESWTLLHELFGREQGQSRQCYYWGFGEPLKGLKRQIKEGIWLWGRALTVLADR